MSNAGLRAVGGVAKKGAKKAAGGFSGACSALFLNSAAP